MKWSCLFTNTLKLNKLDSLIYSNNKKNQQLGTITKINHWSTCELFARCCSSLTDGSISAVTGKVISATSLIGLTGSPLASGPSFDFVSDSSTSVFSSRPASVPESTTVVDLWSAVLVSCISTSGLPMIRFCSATR